MKLITLILTIILTANIAKAQEFYVKNFVQTNHISARTDGRTDDNSIDCAIINIETNLIGLEFDCTYGFCDDVKYDGKGTYRLYVSEGERTLKIMKEGYLPLEYVIEIPIKSLITYKMTLTHKGFAPQDETTKSDFVKMYSTPSSADVYLNGEQKGTTPYEQVVPEGSYIYLIRKDKYYDAQGSLQVIAGNTPEVNENLKPKFGKFIISSNPSGADISINNKPTGKRTPATYDFKDPGKYKVMLQKYKYQAAYKTFTLQEAKTENINLTLTPDFAGITIKTTPESGANIELDGKPLNQTTPYTIPELASGKHKLRVTKKMFKPGDKEFTVTAGQSQTITINMQATFAQLTINTKPNDASIYINGNYIAKGKYTGKQNEGLHIIEIKKDKYKTRKENITIIAGTPLTKTYTLQARKGNIAITTEPTKSEIYINGTKKGISPLMLYDLIIGDYNIEARKTGYAPTIKKVSILENQTINTKLTLQSGLTITINSKPQGASVYINNNYKGKAPQTLALNFGEHKIKLTGIENYKDTEHNINIAQNGRTNYTLLLNSEAPKMVFVKGGTFKMGSNVQDNEKPIHSVTVSDFYIGKYEVTQKLWKEIMGTNPSYFKGDNLPVETVSWNDIQIFLKKLNTKTGKTYRLPTEAEWEYAVKGGASTSSATKYAGSNSIANVAWYSKNSYDKGSTHNDYGTHIVGTKSPNELGIYDMSGNVWEWCSDWYGSDYYSNSPNRNPKGASSGSFRIIRGGSWYSHAGDCRSAYLYYSVPSLRFNDLGFRLCH